ncbi:MAG: hypothetical protein RL637_1877 [Pseudomonadota bacterium]|jgi:uncharacterized protein (DUF934 family)
MHIIKDGELIHNTWEYIADHHPLIAGNITISLQRWQNYQADCLQHQGQLGIRLQSTDHCNSLSNELAKFSLIELEFPRFADGRLFSLAKLLRSRYAYAGEIRAIGHYLTDQVFYLSQVGVNSFAFDTLKQAELALTALQDFSVSYQSND